MADWKTPLSALNAAIAPSAVINGLSLSFPTTTSPGTPPLNGPEAGTTFVTAMTITATTAPSSTASYKTGPGLIRVDGVDFEGKLCTDEIVLTLATGGETVQTQALFASVSEIVIQGMNDTNGSFQFGTANAPSAAEIAAGQTVVDDLTTAGQAYDAEVLLLGSASYIVTLPSFVPAGTSPQIYTGTDANGAIVSSYKPIPTVPPTPRPTANDLYRACRHLVLSTDLNQPPWGTYVWPDTSVHPLPPFDVDVPNNDDLAGQVNGTWLLIREFLQSQTDGLGPIASSFLASTLVPLIASATLWAQYDRDFPAATWKGPTPPIGAAGAGAPPPGRNPPEPLPATDPALVAVQAAIAEANAFLTYAQTP